MPPRFPSVGAVILAAGKGTRMHSAAPKVLQTILREPMLRYVYDALACLGPEHVVTVVGHGADAVRAAFPERAAGFVLQAEQLGTGHALQCAWPSVLASELDHVLVINGDTPLIRAEVVEQLLTQSMDSGADLAFITLTPPEPGAFGRVVRRHGRVAAIIEARDFDPDLHGPASGPVSQEINAGIYCLRTAAIGELLPLLCRNNKNAEYYITDLVTLAVERNLAVLGLCLGNDPDLLGVNSPAELVAAEERLRVRLVQEHMARGVFIRASGSVFIGPEVRIEPGAEITGPCELYGKTHLAAGSRVCSHCVVLDSELAVGAELRSFSHAHGAALGPGCFAGPFARLRPGAVLEENAHVGNFVEVKQSRLGKGAKAGHLTYLGDAEVGPGANIGAGTITCNYDGKSKHCTRIGEGAFVGSNSALIAPVQIGEGALVGAGSVISKDVPDGHLAVTRAPQKMVKRRTQG